MLCLWLLLWYRFDPGPGNFCVPRPKNRQTCFHFQAIGRRFCLQTKSLAPIPTALPLQKYKLTITLLSTATPPGAFRKKESLPHHRQPALHVNTKDLIKGVRFVSWKRLHSYPGANARVPLLSNVCFFLLFHTVLFF